MKIGNITLDNNVILAPMAGISDLPYRIICHNEGCGLVYSEMVSAKGILFNNENTKSLLQTSTDEGPVAMQLFGRDPKILSEIASRLDEYPFHILDLNMGCPVPKVVKNGEGSALLKEPKLIGEIVKKMSSATKKPVSIKIRKGFDDNSVNAVEVAKIIEDNGASSIAIHGRTREQYYSGKADWEIIRQVKNAVSIPVIGNGDIFSPEDAKKMIDYTNCDGVMIARGAEGNPFIFRRTVHYLKTGQLLDEPNIFEKIDMAIKHAKALVEFKGEHIGIREMRRHFNGYTRGIKNSSKIRLLVNKVETLDEFINLLKSIE